MDKVEIRLESDGIPRAGDRQLGLSAGTLSEQPELVLDGRVKVTPFVEKHPLNEINQVFEAAHAGALKRRAVLVPSH